MFLTRVIGRRFLAAARSETSSATAAASTTTMGYNPLEEFFEADRSPNDDKPVVYGRSWKASELRLKSWDDLNKLWYVLLKEKNMLMTQRQMLNAQNLRFPNPERIPKLCDLRACDGAEVNVPNQASTYRESHRRTRSSEICRDEEDGKRSVISEFSTCMQWSLSSR
ncbi:39S ribosomal protein L47, mitochondrial [Cucurbita argyrosperma subsp. argyrosperma]|nr:39S ribosomal protein L47, mitochondrial [Cucurbita argyrosperma subsp. argyrosperma]